MKLNLKSWKENLVQGWQILNGVHPTAYELCKEIPRHFSVTDEDLKDIIGDKTIDDLIDVSWQSNFILSKIFLTLTCQTFN